MAEYDLLIKNGTIVDGLRTPAYRGDIAIRNGKIAAIGPIGAVAANATGWVKDYFSGPRGRVAGLAHEAPAPRG